MNYFTWQGSKEDDRQGRQGPRRELPLPQLERKPEQHADPDSIRVEEHSASTTVVEKIRGALLRKLRGE